MSDAAAAKVGEEEQPTTIPTTKPFNTFLNEHRSAGLHNELSEELQRLVASVLAQGKKGTLTMTIGCAPSDVNGAVVVTDKVVSKPPEPDRDPSLFFSDGTGNLSRRDPRQPELPIRDASAKS